MDEFFKPRQVGQTGVSRIETSLFDGLKRHLDTPPIVVNVECVFDLLLVELPLGYHEWVVLLKDFDEVRSTVFHRGILVGLSSESFLHMSIFEFC